MALQKRTTANITEEAMPTLPRGVAEFLGVALLALGVLVLGGLISYQFGDGSLMGPVGRLLAGSLYAGFGMSSYILAAGIFGLGLKALLGWDVELQPLEALGFATATISGCVLLHVTFPVLRVHGYTAGGLGGELLGELAIGLFSLAGTYVIGVAALTVGLVASTPLRFDHLLAGLRSASQAARLAGSTGLGVALGVWRALTTSEAASEAPRGPRLSSRGSSQSGPSNDDSQEEGEELEDASDEDDEEYEEDEEEEEEDEDDQGDDGEQEAAAEEEDSKNSRRRVAASPRSKQGKPPLAVTAPAQKGAKAADVAAAAAAAALTASAHANAKAAKRGARTAAELAEASLAESAASRAIANTQAPPQSPKERALPEIVVPPTPIEGPALVDGDGAGQDAPSSAGATSKSGKKAPPRPEQLASHVAAVASALQETSRGSDAERSEAPTREQLRAAIAPKRKRSGQVIYTNGSYELPGLNLFEVADTSKVEVDKDFVYAQAEQIEKALAHFRIKGEVTHIHPGPVVTRYEFKPEAGVKVARIQNLENDLAMALEALRIRILAPIPGKATVGLEVPNKVRETVYVQEILGDEGFGSGGKARLPLGLGKSITGKPEWLDLAKAPHVLVAGATGSGKSVGVNTMICSLLYACTPDDVRLILIDPKMLEFSVYQDIPHLLLPVITDADKANLALRWAVNEMERRYALLSEARVRNLEGYNDRLHELQSEWDAELDLREREAANESAACAREGEDALDASKLGGVMFDAQGQGQIAFGGSPMAERPTKMPFIVVIIDEFADLMAVASKEVESNVARIAAKARAAGIHLIVATQRPSVDVITGTIKNNFPTRIAFQVTSEVDSRTILDGKGAKQLLGNGDMLYMDRGKEPQRVHGCFVSEREIEKVVAFIKKQARPSYDLDISAALEDSDAGEVDESKSNDPLYDKAVQIVAETQKVSTSMIQRRLGIGYNRAAKIVEAMEEDGVIGPSRGTTPREVFVNAA